MSVAVQTQPFDIGMEVRALTAGRDDTGAVVAFTGTVRGKAKGRAIREMVLEHYPGMTEREMERIERKANERWPLTGSRIIHRVGTLRPGEEIVLVIAASTHRQAAFEAAAFLMDYLKTSAPFWKKEIGLDGTGTWVDARGTDDCALKRWGD